MSEKIWSDDARRIISTGRTGTKNTKADQPALQDIEQNGCMKGIGKPEPLSSDLPGEYSRLVYHMENGRLYIAHRRTTVEIKERLAFSFICQILYVSALWIIGTPQKSFPLTFPFRRDTRNKTSTTTRT